MIFWDATIASYASSCDMLAAGLRRGIHDDTVTIVSFTKMDLPNQIWFFDCGVLLAIIKI